MKMLDAAELRQVGMAFGVTEMQVRRDHLISHVLHALAELDLPMVFFGGTALARTHLADPEAGGRLSEDIDLYTVGQRRECARILEERLPRLLRREFPGTAWDPSLTQVKDTEPARLFTRDGLPVRLQLLASGGLHAWPTEVRAMEMRYHDVPAVHLRVPTVTAFAAMKTLAWEDRQAPRDLYDLAALARIGALTTDAAELFCQATGRRLAPHIFRTLPKADWQAQLAHQTRLLSSAQDCLDTVREAYGAVLNWDHNAD